LKIKNIFWIALLAMLTTSILFGGNKATAVPPTPQIFVDPPNVIDTSETAGTKFTVNINVSDIPSNTSSPGLFAYEFYLKWDPTNLLSYPLTPITNGNFTYTSSTEWITTTTVTNGTATYGYDTADGNPPPGSSLPSYYHRATSTDSAAASITFTTEQSFTYNFGKANDAFLSYAFTVSGNSIASGGYMRIMLVKPSGSATLLKTVYSIPAGGVKSWTFNGGVMTSASAFSEIGTYKFRLVSLLKTAASGATNYVQANWDDVQLKLVPISISEGPFLKSGGATYFTAKYYEAGYIYVEATLTGAPYDTAYPVGGSGTLANITFFVEQAGSTVLNLYNTVLLTIGPPPYPAVAINHTSANGFFSKEKIQLYYQISTSGGYTAEIAIETNSTVNVPLTLDEQQKMLIFNVTGPSGTIGYANVTIPESFMQGPWTVLVDNHQPLTLDVRSNGTYTFIYLTFTLSTHKIEIIATGVVPEFPFDTILLLILIVATLAGAVIGRKKRNQPKTLGRTRLKKE